MQQSRTGGRQEQPGGHNGHIGWSFAGAAEFEGRVASFLAEGLPDGERLMVVADDPTPGHWPASLVDRGALVISSTAEVYGKDGVVDSVAQRLAFEEALETARELGFSGLRVAADNTSLVADETRLAAWLEWEQVADGIMKVEPITGLCAFDRTRTDGRTLAAVMDCHSVRVE